MVGSDIKARLKIYPGAIVTDSDTLYYNGLILRRDDDYRIDCIRGAVTLLLPPGGEQDTLVLHYTPLPRWLHQQYGREIDRPGQAAAIVAPSLPSAPSTKPAESSDISISGAKRFSFISQRGVASRFDQSLELSISGLLSEGVEISGALSDQSYDPAYGNLNSRLSELDRLYLTVKTTSFISEIGNLELDRPSAFGRPSVKQVSGLRAAYSGRQISARATLARPRGRLESVRFNGQDRNQGPYRISSGGKVLAVVPGSERVWIDGRLLRRGTDNDYTVDYPAATITFSPRFIIDSRSRIEIDYEPLLDSFKRELYQLGGGAATADSGLYVEVDFTREGDSRTQLGGGELDDDDIAFLNSLGDNTDDRYRDGAVADTAGNYVAVTDTAGEIYYQYVGDGNGDYRVGFTAVGSGQGDYLYEGGDRYRFVGPGLGEYLAAREVPVPSDEMFLDTRLGFRPLANTEFSFRMIQSDYDRNLYSGLDEADNRGGRYTLEAGWSGTGSTAEVGPRASVWIDLTGKHYRAPDRRDRPDLVREYLVPDGLTVAGDRKEARVSGRSPLPGPYQLNLKGGWLNYKGQFRAVSGAAELQPSVDYAWLPFLGYRRLETEYDSLSLSRDGAGDLFSVGWKNVAVGEASAAASYTFDRRTNSYTGAARGTTERIISLGLSYSAFSIEAERYDEDTLAGHWSGGRRRDRAAVAATGKYRNITGDLYVIAEKSTVGVSDEQRLMTRLKLAWAPPSGRWQISTQYAVSDESRYERGVRYLEVEPGEGKYIFRDGQYVPDPEGNFIEVEEILSDRAAINNGEKAFNLLWRPEGAYLKLSSSVSEEMLAGYSRSLLWTLPFWSDGDKEYLLRKLNHAGELKLVNRSGYYIINLAARYDFEARRIGSVVYERYDQTVHAEMHESAAGWHFFQKGDYFKYRRDSYYNAPGVIDGYRFGLETSFRSDHDRLTAGIGYRRAANAGESRSRQYIVTLSYLWHPAGLGEIRLELDGYRQELTAAPAVSYRLTDDRSGKRGARWSLRSEARLSRETRITVSFTGRHADDSRPRIYGRGELIASF